MWDEYMREIKFRAWNKANKVMYDFVDNSSSPEYRNLNTYLERIQNACVLMQFTGLKDKNGKEIYEGDIIKCNSSDDDWNDSVVFKLGCFELNLWNKEVSHMYPNLLEVLSDAEIIGNIYENPELLN